MQDKPVLLMKKIINLFFRELDAMNSEKLQEPISGHNMIVIEYLMRHEEPVYQRDLENHFLVRRSTISKVLRLMEEKGMIQRLSVHDDARLKQIVLTDYGRRIHGEAVRHAQMLEGKLYRNFTEEEMDTLLLLLKKLEHNMEETEKETLC